MAPPLIADEDETNTIAGGEENKSARSNEACKQIYLNLD